MTARLEHPALRGRPIYLDYNATTPIDPVVVEAMTPCLIEEFGNPSSGHAYGAAAQIGLTRARDQVAELIGASDDTMVFTGSGSEADALAIRGAPKGVGALYVRAGVRLRPLIAGGGQEHGIGAGTENIASIVGFGHAAALAAEALAGGESGRLVELRDRFERHLGELLPGRVHLNGHPTQRLPNTANLRIDGAPALSLLAAMRAVAVSAGSACHAGRDEPSPVLTAMGPSTEDALCALRISVGRWTTADEIDEACTVIAAVVPDVSF